MAVFPRIDGVGQLKRLLYCVAVAAVSLGLVGKASAADGYPLGALRGLKAVKVEVVTSEDVKRDLHFNGTDVAKLHGDLEKIAKDKLKLAGAAAESGDKGEPVLAIVLDNDLTTNEFDVTLRLTDQVSLVRDPNLRFNTTIWSKTGHPLANAGPQIERAFGDLSDQFMADYLSVNESGKGASSK
jgi:hypothetical protein